MRKLTLLTLPLLLSVFAASARPDYLYTFSFTPTTGTIESFGFSFTVPTFVTTGQSPAFTPFTMTDGTRTSAMMTQDFVYYDGTVGLECFEFGTATNAVLGPCGEASGSPNGGVLTLEAFSGLPTGTGIYSLPDSSASFNNTSPPGVGSQGTGSLIISNTSVPEPASVVFLVTVAALIDWRFRRGLGGRPTSGKLA